jgi:single-strand DNA-binding protein
MKSLNLVQMIGNLGADPEFKEHNGVMICKFSVATSEEWVDKVTAEKNTKSEWHKVVCFNKLAEITNKYLKKGSRIYLSGKIRISKWQDKNNETRCLTEIIADELIMLSHKLEDLDST